MDAPNTRYIGSTGLLAALALTSAVCLGQKSGKSAASAPAGQYERKLKDRDFIDAGSAIFVPSCSSAYCHGSGGMGGAAPRLRGRDLEPAYVFKTVTNGIPGSAMVAFKSELSEEQRWKLVAFILSPVRAREPVAGGPAESGSRPGASPGPSGAASPLPSGDAAGGRDLFYDLANQLSCHGCHAVQGVGGKVGPDLAEAGSSRSAADLLSAILKPHRVTDSKYTKVTIVLANGDKIVGIRKDDGRDAVRVYDTTVLPAVLRTVLKSEIVTIETSEEPVMPGNYGLVYTEKQLADIVAFLKSISGKAER